MIYRVEGLKASILYFIACLPSGLCINGHIRLAGGRDTNEGRVEICSNGIWGTIWDGGWDSRDAIVACRQLGLYQPHSSKLTACIILPGIMIIGT